MTVMTNLLQTLRNVADYSLFTLGDQPVTLMRLLIVSAFVFAFLVMRKRFRNAITKILKKGIREDKQLYAATSIVSIIVWTVVLLVVMELLGVAVSSLVAIFAALGIGIGFGLQNLVNNASGGLILLFERPVNVGDIVKVDGHFGLIQEIGWRTTRLLNWDNIEIILPNSKFMDGTLENWTLSSPVARVGLHFGVRYDSDRKLVREVALRCATEHSSIEKVPEPMLLLRNFGESSLDYTINLWTREVWRQNIILSEIRERLMDEFTTHGIVIPFPQRDIHVMEPIHARVERGTSDGEDD